MTNAQFSFSYTTKEFAFANGLAYVDNGTVVMKGDNTTQLTSGVYRNRYVIPCNAVHAGD